MHFSQKREFFLFPITTLLPSLIVCFLFVISLSVRAARTVFCSFFVRSLFVLCSFFVRSLFVLCSSFVRLLFVFCSLIIYLPVRLAPARVARTIYLLCYDFALFYLLPFTYIISIVISNSLVPLNL